MTRHTFSSFCFAVLISLLIAGPAAAELPPPEMLRGWIREMKLSPKGPFEAIRWYCHSNIRRCPTGRSAAAASTASGARAPGAARRRLAIANLLAELEPADFGRARGADTLRMVLVERFLVRADDGWIFRRATGYRGAFRPRTRGRRAGGAAP
jgi:hypothetical protein